MASEIIDDLKDNVGPVLEKAYDDLVHPSANAAGIVLSYPCRIIRVLFSPLEKWIINREESIKLVADSVHKKLEGVPEERLCTPEPYVAIPIIQQICLSQDSEDLREMYANLLVASMNIDTKNKVLPGFVNIIGQLSPDEAKLLKYMYEKEDIPALYIKIIRSIDNDSKYITATDCFISLPTELLDIPDNLNVYLGNLIRMQLLNIDKEALLTDKQKEYENLIDKFKKNIVKNEFLKDKIFIFEREILEITPFGYSFAKICLGDE